MSTVGTQTRRRTKCRLSQRGTVIAELSVYGMRRDCNFCNLPAVGKYLQHSRSMLSCAWNRHPIPLVAPASRLPYPISRVGVERSIMRVNLF
jgi:hypothetical protein